MKIGNEEQNLLITRLSLFIRIPTEYLLRVKDFLQTTTFHIAEFEKFGSVNKHKA